MPGKSASGLGSIKRIRFARIRFSLHELFLSGHRKGDVKFFADQSDATKAIPRQGIRSGDTGTMVAVNDSRTIDVQLDKQSAKATLDLATLSNRDITLGYSATASQIKVQSLGKVYIQACDKIVSQHFEYVAITRQSPKVKVYQNVASADANLLTVAESTEKKLQPTPDQNRSHSNRLTINRRDC
ncbi:MAG: hypothetical protein NTU79_02580 [Planctomycetota bacterium]|nr:hypothetical protein [Planctomycetota bacterium]